jgi:polyphosphate kinase
LLVVRKEEGVIRRYLHLSTGNYNDTTAKVYTDAGMLTDNANLCSDIASLFNVMTGYSEPPEWKKISVAPFNLRERFISLIEREARNSTKHNPGRIIVKINALEDKGIIEHLYRAAYVGVKIDLIVRGLCCLKPGIETKNINIISIVDRYLEHSRIYYFGNGGNPEFYLSSADWMPRNLDRRIEILFPVESQYDKDILMGILELQMNDNVKGRRMDSSGNYPRSKELNIGTRSQIKMYDLLNHFRPIQQENKRIKVFEKCEE